MVLNTTQLRVLILKFDNADVFKQVCNGIDWTGIDVDSFLQYLNSNDNLKRLLIRAAIYAGESHTPYTKLCLDINDGGSVKAALKVRLDRMKLVYQKVYPNVTLTPEERQYRRDKLWEYIEEDRNKWGI
jgi:hypothetical protein